MQKEHQGLLNRLFPRATTLVDEAGHEAYYGSALREYDFRAFRRTLKLGEGPYLALSLAAYALALAADLATLPSRLDLHRE